MKTKVYSHKFFKIILSVMTVVFLAMVGFSLASATTTSSTITMWGSNNRGEQNIPPDLTDVVAISADASYTLALKSNGTVIGWGYNNQGQLDIPADLAGVVAISAGGVHSLALKSDGSVVAWGDNAQGEIDIPSGLTSVIAISAGNEHSLALQSDGTVVGWGSTTFGEATIPVGLTDVIAISAGGWHSLALKSDHTVVAWGHNGFGQTNIPVGLSDVVAISAGFSHSLALKSDGTVVAWGSNGNGQTNVPVGLAGVIAIEAGGYHSLALKSDGTVIGWGRNLEGETTIPADLTGVDALAAGEQHSVALIQVEIPDNTAPSANPGGPYLGAVNTSISFDGSSSSDPEGDPLTYAWDFGDGATGTEAMPAHTFTSTGLYNICLTVNDRALDSEVACTMAVVYDPSAGFVTGGGWIDSPAGAYKDNQSLAGRANFGFVAKYLKGSNVPTGTTSFKFDLAGMVFASQSYDWLVVNQNASNGQFKGTGTVNGALDPNGNAYKFMLWASDGSPDTFRIRIWYDDAGSEVDVYDNGVNQPIGAGNIVVHTSK